MSKITCEDAVMVLKKARTFQSAQYIAAELNASPRAVATCLRRATRDGRVTMRFRRGVGIALYRFERLTPKG